jgi:hypothetical protein
MRTLSLHGIVSCGLAALPITILCACADVPGVFYELRSPGLASGSTCAVALDAIARGIDVPVIRYIDYPRFSSKYFRFECLGTLTTTEQKPKVSISVDAWSDDPRVIVHVHEYRWGRRTPPSDATRKLAERVIEIVKAQFPETVVTSFHPKEKFPF